MFSWGLAGISLMSLSPLRLAAGAFFRLEIVKHFQIIDIHICIVLLPWIRPQAPFSDLFVVVKTCNIIEIIRHSLKPIDRSTFFDTS